MRDPVPVEREQCARISQKLLKAAAADSELAVFGSEVHQYRLGPPLSVSEVDAFETRNQVELPSEYTAFLTLVGNGGPAGEAGAGPNYGLYAFGCVDWFCDNDCMTVDLPSLSLKGGCRSIVQGVRLLRQRSEDGAPQMAISHCMTILQELVDDLFDDGSSHPLSGPDDPLLTQICDAATEGVHAHLRGEYWVRPKTGRGAAWEELPTVPDSEEDPDSRAWENICRDGILPLCEQGCGDITALVLSGPARGRIVNMYVDDPYTPPHLAHDSDFLCWYERWLDEIIAGYHLEGCSLGFFGQFMGGTEEELLAKTRDPKTRFDAVEGLMNRPPTSLSGMQMLIDLFPECDVRVQDLLIEHLVKLCYDQALPLLQAEFTSHPEAVCRAVSLHAQDRAYEWVEAIEALGDIDDNLSDSVGRLLRVANTNHGGTVPGWRAPGRGR